MLTSPDINQRDGKHGDQLIPAAPPGVSSGRFEQSKLDGLAALGLMLLVIAFFAPTVFGGCPISKISRLAEWDSLFSAYRTGANAAMDPSLIQLMIPYYFLSANIWQTGHIPLWNPYTALGVPLLADIQSQAFSPLHLPFYFFPTMQVYNLELVSRVCIGVVAAYLFARSLQLPRYAGAFASLSYCLCPYILWYSELMGAGYFILPLVFWSFVELAKKSGWTRLVLSGGACALLLVSAHPEISFFGIISAAALLWCLKVSAAENSAVPVIKKLAAATRHSAFLIMGCAVLTVCLAAPVLLPFVEYLLHSDSYKFATAACAYVPWQAVLYNLLQPGFAGASSYLGVVAVMVLPLAVMLRNYRVRAVSIVALLTLLVSCCIGPLAWLVEIKPFSYLMTIYCLPDFLLLTAVLAAFGLQAAVERSQVKIQTKLLLLGLLLALGIPLVLWLGKVPLAAGKFDDALPTMAFSFNAFKRDLALAVIFLLVIMAGKWLSEKQKLITAFVCVLLSFISQAGVARTSMPVQSKFDYPLVEPLKDIQTSQSRVLSVGTHVLRPNTNVVYGISQLQCHSPMFPAGYLDFMRACGAQLEQYGQKFSGDLGALIDLASVRLVVSQVPLVSAGQAVSPGQKVVMPVLRDPLALSSAEYRYDPQSAALIGVLKWRAHTAEPARYTYLINVLDEAGQTLWFSDQQAWAAPDQEGVSAQKFAVPLPLNQLPGSRLQVGVRLFDTKLSKFVDSTAPAALLVDSTLIFAKLEVGTPVPAAAKAGKPRFALQGETANQIRLYKNPGALPAAYIAHKIVLASGADALQIMASQNFDARNTVVLEQALPVRPATNMAPEVVKLSRPDTNSALIETASREPGVLVLTDMYFPGWKAYIDGKPTPIWRANHLMRAVQLPAGRHQVRFVYDPLSFRIGLWLWLACLSGIGMTALGTWFKHKQVKNAQ